MILWKMYANSITYLCVIVNDKHRSEQVFLIIYILNRAVVNDKLHSPPKIRSRHKARSIENERPEATNAEWISVRSKQG